jgi:hypothetical protein
MMGSLAQLLLIGVLAACAMSLWTQLAATWSGIAVERSRAVTTERLELASIAGIDVHGTIRDALPDRARRLVITGFRSSTFDQDIRLWTTVVSLLADEPDIHVIAYCDDAPCANAARARSSVPRFTVMRYGEASSSQAVLYADGRGECLVLSPDMKTLRRVTWRAPGTLAEDIAREVRQ